MNKDLKNYTDIEICEEYLHRELRNNVEYTFQRLSDWIEQGQLVFDSERNTLTFKEKGVTIELDLKKNELNEKKEKF